MLSRICFLIGYKLLTATNLATKNFSPNWCAFNSSAFQTIEKTHSQKKKHRHTSPLQNKNMFQHQKKRIPDPLSNHQEHVEAHAPVKIRNLDRLATYSIHPIGESLLIFFESLLLPAFSFKGVVLYSTWNKCFTKLDFPEIRIFPLLFATWG